MNGAILDRIYNARVQLRSRGERDTQDAVREIVGGSKSTLVKYWSASDPTTYTPNEAQEASTPSPAVTVPAHANGDTAPVVTTDDANEAVFEETFAAYLDAAIKFGAVSGLRVRYTYPPQHGRRAPDLIRDFDVGRSHPKYQQLEEALRQAYKKHMDAWAMLEGDEETQLPEPEAEPEPVPLSPPLGLETLRAYYRSGGPAPWGSGAKWPDADKPPLAAYPLLTQLFQEADALVVKGWQAWMQAKNEAGARSGTHDAASVRQAEERWSTERLLQSRLKSEIDNMEQRAHYEGKTLTT